MTKFNEEFRQPRLIFLSTRQSVENAIPSLSAISETVFAVVLYWFGAVYFETYWFLLAGLLAGLLLLFRSKESVALGVDLFKRWEEASRSTQASEYKSLGRKRQQAHSRYLYAAAALRAVAAFVIGFVLARYFMADAESFAAVAGGFAITWISAAAAIALLIASATAMATRIVLTVEDLKPVGVPVILQASVGAAVGIFFGSYPHSVSAALVGSIIAATCASIFGFVARRWIGRISIFVLLIATLLVVGACALISPVLMPAGLIVASSTVFGSASGVLIVALFIRIFSTLRHLYPAGLNALGKAYYQLIWCTGPTHQPELVPGLANDKTYFTLGHLWNKMSDSKDLLSRALYTILIIVWFGSGWVYRFALKSTAWFWIFIALATREPIRDPRLLALEVVEAKLSRIRICVAVAIITAFLVSSFWSWNANNDVEALPPWTLVALIVIAGWPAPWQLTGLTSAVIKVSVYYWADLYRIRLDHARCSQDESLQARAQSAFKSIERLTNIGAALGVLYFLGAAIHLVLFINSKQCLMQLPVNVENWIQWLYGKWAPLSGGCI